MTIAEQLERDDNCIRCKQALYWGIRASFNENLPNSYSAKCCNLYYYKEGFFGQVRVDDLRTKMQVKR